MYRNEGELCAGCRALLTNTVTIAHTGEWWGHFKDNDLRTVLTMKQTQWYQQDMFGLLTSDAHLTLI